MNLTDQPTPTPETTAPDAPAAVDLSFVGADFHTEGQPDLGKFRTHYEDLVARDAQRAERLAAVPEDGAYDFAPPDDLTFDGLELPDGFEVKIDPKDPVTEPLFGELSAWLKEVGATGDDAKKLTGMLAKYEAAKYSQAWKQGMEALKPLGTKSQIEARVNAVNRALQSKLPGPQAQALVNAVGTAAGVQALEALLQPKTFASPTPQPSAPDLSNLSPYERLKAINAQTPLPPRRT
jgi:hypothetical protein